MWRGKKQSRKKTAGGVGQNRVVNALITGLGDWVETMIGVKLNKEENELGLPKSGCRNCIHKITKFKEFIENVSKVQADFKWQR